MSNSICPKCKRTMPWYLMAPAPSGLDEDRICIECACGFTNDPTYIERSKKGRLDFYSCDGCEHGCTTVVTRGDKNYRLVTNHCYVVDAPLDARPNFQRVHFE